MDKQNLLSVVVADDEQELLGAKNDNPVETLVQSEKAGEQQ